MIPSCERFLAGLRFFARRYALPTQFDEAAIAEALAEATHLVSTETDESAALFFACARRSRAFAGSAGRIAPFVARSHAWSLGLELRIEDLELEILRARILLGVIEFEEFRARFKAQLRPSAIEAQRRGAPARSTPEGPERSRRRGGDQSGRSGYCPPNPRACCRPQCNDGRPPNASRA